MSITIKNDTDRFAKIEKLLADVFYNKTQGAETAIDAWMYMRFNTIQELKGIFTERELYAMIDSYNGTIFEPQFCCNNRFLLGHIEDTYTFSGFSQNWEVDKEVLLGKIDKLTSSQTYYLLEEIQRFWEKLSREPNSLENFVAVFL